MVKTLYSILHRSLDLTPISIAKKVEILYLPLTLASLANVVSILIDNKLR
ncbi:hypothetical protein NUITMVRE13_26960 [Enterococcus faecium]|nr:hypothetical protein NUITMVRE13_26960 [Enterococcus faecium]